MHLTYINQIDVKVTENEKPDIWFKYMRGIERFRQD